MKTKFLGKRPAMFYQEGKGDPQCFSNGPRVRIFYPDGTAEWCALTFAGPEYNPENRYMWGDLPCYVIGAMPSSMYDAIALADAYDVTKGFPPMEYLGDL